MIITFTKRDFDIVESAIKDQKTGKFGILYCYLPQHVNYPRADNKEDIYLTAHGNDNEIGDTSEFGLSATKVADIIYDTFIGGNWSASIYISTCDSYPHFAGDVLGRLEQRDPNRMWQVYGAEGKIGYPILLKNDVSWKQAG